MDIVESIHDLQVQDPPVEELSSADLTWTKFGTPENHDDAALIPYDRVDAFIIGECSNFEYPTRFPIERGRKRKKGSLREYTQYSDAEYLEYKLRKSRIKELAAMYHVECLSYCQELLELPQKGDEVRCHVLMCSIGSWQTKARGLLRLLQKIRSLAPGLYS